jgi:hypothetical protein
MNHLAPELNTVMMRLACGDNSIFSFVNSQPCLIAWSHSLVITGPEPVIQSFAGWPGQARP